MVEIEYDPMPIGQQCDKDDCVFKIPDDSAAGTNSICQCTHRLFQSHGGQLKAVERYVENHLRDKNRELVRLQKLFNENQLELWELRTALATLFSGAGFKPPEGE